MMKKSRKGLAAASCAFLATAVGAQVAKAEESLVTVATKGADTTASDGSKTFNVYLTGYTFWDNTPPRLGRDCPTGSSQQGGWHWNLAKPDHDRGRAPD